MYYHFYINETKKRQFVNTNIELIRKLKKNLFLNMLLYFFNSEFRYNLLFKFFSPPKLALSKAQWG